MSHDKIAALPFRDMLEALNITQAELSRRWDFPLRTMSHWCAGDRQCPVYVKKMLVELIRKETGV